jgi:hypothetical protein
MRRLFLLPICVAGSFPGPVWAQNALPAQLHECAAIVGSVERLACYDGLVRGTPPAPAAAPLPQNFQRPATPPPPQNAAADFGADTLPQAAPTPPGRSPLESITAQVTDFSFDSRGHFIVTLSNGQVWKEIEGDQVGVALRKDLTHTATISRAILWSYSIRFDNPRGLFKVIRVR